MDVVCPKGHNSTDPDYCSECGAKIDATVPAVTLAAPAENGSAPSSGNDVCPDCGTKRTSPSALFCEVCRYNFSTHQSWSTPAVTVAAPIQSPPAVAAPAAIEPVVTDPPASTTVDVQVSNNEFIGWDALLSIDPTLYTDPDPDIPLPTDPDRTFPLDLADNLIGRRSDRLDIHPEINVNDPGVSHRHAKLLREENGKLLLLDLSSTNGTQLNGANILPGVRTPVANGDQITIGTWTKIVIHGRRP